MGRKLQSEPLDAACPVRECRLVFPGETRAEAVSELAAHFMREHAEHYAQVASDGGKRNRVSDKQRAQAREGLARLRKGGA
jgi:hypothetical protein